MALFTYFTAPCSLRVVMERRWKQLPLALFWTYASVDGCYALYWHFTDPVALEQMRWANAPASLTLYGIGDSHGSTYLRSLACWSLNVITSCYASPLEQLPHHILTRVRGAPCRHQCMGFLGK